MLRLRKTRHGLAAAWLLAAFLAALLNTTANGAEIEPNLPFAATEVEPTRSDQAASPQQSCPVGIAPEAPQPAGRNLTLAFAADSRAAVDGSTIVALRWCASRAGAGGPLTLLRNVKGGQTLACRSVSLTGPVDAGRGNCHVIAPGGILSPTDQASLIACDRISGLQPAERRGAWQLLPAAGTWWDANGGSPAAERGRGSVCCLETSRRQSGVQGDTFAAGAETSQTSGTYTPPSSRKSWLARAALALNLLPGTGLQADKAPARSSLGPAANACHPG